MQVIRLKQAKNRLLHSRSFLEKVSLTERPGVFYTLFPYMELGPQIQFAAHTMGHRTNRDSIRLSGHAITIFHKDGSQEVRRFDERAMQEPLEMLARRLSVEFHTKTILGRAIALINERPLLQTVIEVEPDEEFFIELHKRVLDPTKKSDFEQLNRELANKLRNKTNPVQAKVINDMINALGVSLAGLTATQIDTLVDTAKNVWIGVPSEIQQITAEVFKRDIEPFYKKVRNKEITVNKFDIPRDIDLRDVRLKESIIRDQALFARDEFFKRSDDISELARGVIAKGNDIGLGSKAITAELRTALVGEAAFKQKGYWPVISNVFQNRARTGASLKTYNDVGVERYRIVATLDQATTEVCRFMHGQILSVPRALENFQEVEGLTDPEEVKLTNPFIRINRQKDGSRDLVVRNRSGGRVVKKRLATINKSGLGRKNTRGTFKNAASANSIMDAGVGGPPYHGKCRTITVPEL